MTSLVKYDAACRALADARSVDEAKDVHDKAEAMRIYARQAKNTQLEADAWEIRKRAEDRMGALSAALDKSAGGRNPDATLPTDGKSKSAVLREAGISTSAANRYEHFNALPEAEKEERIARGRAAIETGKSVADAVIRGEEKASKREIREKILAGIQTALPERRFGVILADPEWRFEPYSRDSGMDRAADNHYPTSATDVIASRPVQDIAAPDCVLFLWATVPMLPDALRVMEAWGFAYKSHFIWNKDKIGTGYWNRNKHELLLVGTRGNIPAPIMGSQAHSVIDAPVRLHSEKPAAFYLLIENYFPNLPKIELNARKARAGWERWGNEAPKQGEAA